MVFTHYVHVKEKTAINILIMDFKHYKKLDDMSGDVGTNLRWFIPAVECFPCSVYLLGVQGQDLFKCMKWLTQNEYFYQYRQSE